MFPPLAAIVKRLPAPLRRLGNRLMGSEIRFSGTYGSWIEAVRQASGYETENILDRVKESALKVKRGEAAYERDSIAFSDPQHPYPALSGLMLAGAMNQGRLSVLDFGGSLGSTYFQCRDLFSGLSDLCWGIVEQPHFVRCGREHFEDGQLKFCESIQECQSRYRPNAVLLSSVLQYLEKPYDVIGELAAINPSVIVVDRTPFTEKRENLITVQHVPKSIYRASYPSWIFSRQQFLERFPASYRAISQFDALDCSIRSGGLEARYAGIIFLKRPPAGGS